MKLLAMTVVGCVGSILTYLALEKYPEHWGWIAFITVILCVIISETD